MALDIPTLVPGEFAALRCSPLHEGSRVRVVRATYTNAKGDTEHFFKVSFPDSGCANFYLESTNEKDAAVIDFIARSFRPRGLTPSFIRSCLKYFGPTADTGMNCPAAF